MLFTGIVLMDNITWLSFHSSYDFAYLLKLLTNKNLPQSENEFFSNLKLFFPKIYDVKVSNMKSHPLLRLIIKSIHKRTIPKVRLWNAI